MTSSNEAVPAFPLEINTCSAVQQSVCIFLHKFEFFLQNISYFID